MPDPEPREFDEAERRILEAAHRVFVRRGTAGARTQEIADEADVSKSMLHYYFRTKETLAYAVFQMAASEWLRDFARGVEADAPLDVLVRDVIASEVRAVVERPYLSGYILSEIHQRPERVREAIRATSPPNLTRLRQRLAAAAEAGEIAPVTAEDFVVYMISLIVFPVVTSPAFDAFLGVSPVDWQEEQDARVDRLATFFLRGIGFDPSS